MCLIGYAGFFRFSELSSMTVSDVKVFFFVFFPSYVSIFLESSNTDQLRQGAWIVLARSGQPTCPVKTLEYYIVAALINMSDDSPLFRSLWRSKDSQVRGITYTRAREIVKEALQGFTDVSKIAVHSLRSGGATAAANAGVKDRMLQRHGRWVSENAKDGYVKDNR